MILTITPNPAIDVTYHVPGARWGEVNRVETVREAPGGKGVNVARVLRQLGDAVTCTGFLGGETGDRLSALLTGVEQRWVRVPHPTRRTTAIVDTTGVTLFNEPGSPVPASAWDELRSVVCELAGTGDVVTVSGSLPVGTIGDAVAGVVHAARSRGARVVVDTSGPGLRAAARAGATVLKPNRDELREVTGIADVAEAAATLLDDGADAVVASLGEDGVLACARADGRRHAWRARPPRVLAGNPTGAGDAAVAALARALHGDPGPTGTVLAENLADVVALSAAAVLRPVAGEVDVDAYRRMRAAIPVDAVELGVPAGDAGA